MHELSTVIEDLRRCAGILIETADRLAQALSDEEHKPEDNPLTLEAVRAILADKSRAGCTAQIHSLLQKYGANKLSDIDPSNYRALLNDVEGLGHAT